TTWTLAALIKRLGGIQKLKALVDRLAGAALARRLTPWRSSKAPRTAQDGPQSPWTISRRPGPGGTPRGRNRQAPERPSVLTRKTPTPPSTKMLTARTQPTEVFDQCRKRWTGFTA